MKNDPQMISASTTVPFKTVIIDPDTDSRITALEQALIRVLSCETCNGTGRQFHWISDADGKGQHRVESKCPCRTEALALLKGEPK